MKHSREDILEGGIELFRNNGYQGTGIQHILKSLNIPKGSFYNYFKSKEEFVLESISLYASIGLENHKRLLGDSTLSPISRLKNLIDDIQKQYIIESFKKSCLMDMLASEISGNNDTIANLIDVFFKSFFFLGTWPFKKHYHLCFNLFRVIVFNSDLH